QMHHCRPPTPPALWERCAGRSGWMQAAKTRDRSVLAIFARLGDARAHESGVLMSYRQTLALALLAGNGAMLVKTFDIVTNVRGLGDGATTVLGLASLGVMLAFGAVAKAGDADEAKPNGVRDYRGLLLGGTLLFVMMLVIAATVAPSLANARG